MERDTVLQLHYVVDHPKVDDLFRKNCLSVILLKMTHFSSYYSVMQRATVV